MDGSLGPVDDPGRTESAVTGVLPATLRVAVVLYNFSDHRDAPMGPAEVRDLVFSGTGSAPATASVNSYFREITETRMSITGDVFGWHTLARSARAADGRLDVVECGLLADIEAAAAGSGFSRNNYDVVIYATSFAILGSYKGGKIIFAEAMSRQRSLGIFAHEIGHFLGLSHANTYTCGGPGNYVSIDQSAACSPNEYGDGTSLMGGGSPTFHPSSFEKLAIGAWSPAQVRDIRAQSTGVYWLPALERGGVPGSRALRIPLRRTPYAGLAAYYYLDYRQALGFDSPLATTPFVGGVSIHLGADYAWKNDSPDCGGNFRYSASPLLIDATPETGGLFNDAPLTLGRTFRDATEGLSVRVISMNRLGALVDVGCGERRLTAARPGIQGTTPGMVMDGDATSGFKTGHDGWQYVQIDAGCEIEVRRIRRHMTPGANPPFPGRALQGEQISYSLDGRNYTFLATNRTSGWQRYVAYDGRAWHSVGYDWSAWLDLNTPVRARYIRYHWDGNGPDEALNEIELD